MDELLGEGIAAAKSGQRERAYDLLMQVVQADEENILAWLWLSEVADNLDDREICLENVLALDPTNEAARKGLAWLREQKKGAGSTPDEPVLESSSTQEASPAASTPARIPVSPAAAILRHDFARRQPAPTPELPPLTLRDEFDNEYLCAYCAAQTEPGDRNCAACGNKLWTKTRRREGRSSWLWIALTLQAAGIIWPAFLSTLVLFYAASRAGLDNFLLLLAPYLGLPSDLPSEMVNSAFEAIPRAYIMPLAVYILFSLAVMAGLYLRWKPVFYFYVFNALLVLVSAFAGMAVSLSKGAEEAALGSRVGVLCSGGGLILGLMMFFLVLQLEDDFFFDEKRLLLRPDRDATNGPALLSSGRDYARREMWAMAAIHLRRATSHLPHQIEPYLALAATYLNLKRYDLAADVLEEARRIAPDNPQVERLTTVLDFKMRTDLENR